MIPAKLFIGHNRLLRQPPPDSAIDSITFWSNCPETMDSFNLGGLRKASGLVTP